MDQPEVYPNNASGKSPVISCHSHVRYNIHIMIIVSWSLYFDSSIDIIYLILFLGLPTEKTLRMFKFLNVACVSRSAFYRHTTAYITPTIVQCWKNEQNTLCQQLKDTGKPLILTGDGRCDSPGHSAKFGSYTVIEQTINSHWFPTCSGWL